MSNNPEKPVSVLFTEQVNDIILTEQLKTGLPFNEVVNNLILKAHLCDPIHTTQFLENQDKLNKIILELLERPEKVRLVPKAPGIIPKKVSLNGVVYDSVKDAMCKLNITQGAVSSRIRKHPDINFYIEHNQEEKTDATNV